MNPERSGSLVFVPAVMMWLFTLFGIVSGGSSRHRLPPAEAKVESTTPADRWVRARLWEDPLEIVGALKYRPLLYDAPHAIREEALKNTGAAAGLKPMPLGKDRALVVLLRGQPYPADAESRRRARHAVHAAMAAAEYEREDPARLHFEDIGFDGLWHGGVCPVDVKATQDWFLRVPKEVFKKKNERVQVLWLNTDLLDLPLRRIGMILHAMGWEGTQAYVVGPPSTDWLFALESEFAGDGGSRTTEEQAPETNLPKIRAGEIKLAVINAQAYGGPPEQADYRTVHAPALDLKARIIRRTPPGAAAVTTLLDELEARGLEPGARDFFEGGRNHLLVMAERDTRFGRNFADQIVARATSTLGGATGQDITIQYYLRGTAGHPPTFRAAGGVLETRPVEPVAAMGNNSSQAVIRALAPEAMPEPFGPSQADYLKRLGQRLERDDFERRHRGLGSIRCVALLGTDMDDKLDVLAALRPRFPKAVFFTTNLEAEYLLPDRTKLCRNLLVASPHPLAQSILDVRDPVTGSFLSEDTTVLRRPQTFARAGLQWAIWHAVRDALDGNELSRVPEMKLYEIGINHVHRLRQKGGSAPVTPVAPWNFLQIPWLVWTAGVAFLLWCAWRRPAVPTVQRSVSATEQAGAASRSWWQRVDGVIWRKWPPSVLENDEVEATPGEGQIGLNHEPTRSLWVPVLLLLGALAYRAGGLFGGEHVLMVAGFGVFAWLLLRPRAWVEERMRLLLLGTFVVILLVAVLGQIARGAGQEAVVLADGVSVWPAVGMRCVAILLACLWVRQAGKMMIRSWDKLTEKFFLELDPQHSGTGVRKFVHRRFPSRQELRQSTHPEQREMSRRAEHEAAEWAQYLARADWTQPTVPGRKSFLQRWRQWTWAGLAGAGMLMAVAGFPTANTRGAWAQYADSLSLFLTLYTLMRLAVFVILQMKECRAFSDRIYGHGLTAWGLETEEAITLVARLTKPVGNLVLYPFGIGFILLCAHSRFFEQWWGVAGFYAVLAAVLAAVFLASRAMEREAEHVRTRTLGYLRQVATEALWLKRLILQRMEHPERDTEQAGAERSNRLRWWHYTITRLGYHISPPEVPRVAKYVRVDDDVAALVPENERASWSGDREWDVKFQDARLQRIERLIEIVKNLREGAFRPLLENPTLAAVLLPAGGYGSLELIQWMLGG